MIFLSAKTRAFKIVIFRKLYLESGSFIVVDIVIKIHRFVRGL